MQLYCFQHSDLAQVSLHNNVLCHIEIPLVAEASEQEEEVLFAVWAVIMLRNHRGIFFSLGQHRNYHAV